MTFSPVFLSSSPLRCDGSTQTPGSLIKGWEEQDGKQELLAAAFTDAFM